jgi:hypothetical protein
MFNNNSVYYINRVIDKNKIDALTEIIDQEWVIKNPVYFGVYDDKLYVIKGETTIEVCIHMDSESLMRALFDSARYKKIKEEPEHKIKKHIPIDLFNISELFEKNPSSEKDIPINEKDIIKILHLNRKTQVVDDIMQEIMKIYTQTPTLSKNELMKIAEVICLNKCGRKKPEPIKII